MSTNNYYVVSGTPGTGSAGASAPVRSEFAAIQAGFGLLPALTGFGGCAVVVNALGTALGTTTGQLALAGNFATTGAFNTTLAQTGTVTLTLPAVSGTLATLAGTETLQNKTLIAPVLGTPASGNLTNCTGTATGLTAGNATVAATATFATTAGTATSADTVTTNANLTGPITSAGNATSVAAQTGTGSTFVMNTSPTLVTPVIGVATGTSLNLSGALTTGGTLTANGTVAFGTQSATGGNYQGAGAVINALGSITGSNAVNYTLGNVFTATQNNGTLTFTFTNWPASGTYACLEAIVALDSTPHTVTFTGVTWDTNLGAPTLVASKELHVMLETIDGGSTIKASLAGQF